MPENQATQSEITPRTDVLQDLNTSLMVLYVLQEKGKNSRPLTLAITNLEQSIIWLEKSITNEV